MKKYYIDYLRNGIVELLKDDKVMLLGEDIQEPYGGAFKVTKGLSTRYPDQIISTPMSEQGFTGMGVGLSLAGFKPIVEIMFGDFITLTVDQLVNHISKFRWLYNKTLHFIIRTPMGGYRGYGPTHSQSLEKLFFGLPELNVIAPSIVDDPGLVLKNSMNIGKPVIFIENKLDYSAKLLEDRNDFYKIEKDDTLFPIYTIYYDEKYSDLTLITYGGLTKNSVILQKELYMEEEISVKIINPTLVSPLDFYSMYEKVKNDKKILVLEEGHTPFGWGDTVLSQLYQLGYRGYIRTIGAKNNVIGAARNIEESILPDFNKIKRLFIKLVG